MAGFSEGAPRARTLAAMLQEARTGFGISARELARRLQVAHTTVGRWENGQTVPNAEDVSALLACLEIGGEERERILSLARDTVTDDWLTSGLPGVAQQLASVLEFERTARHITQWAPLLIPGLLQTSDYARATLGPGTLPRDETETRLLMRMARRDALVRRDPTRLIAVIGEPAIRGGIGGHAVMVDQLRHLLKMAEVDSVTIQIAGLAGAWHPGHMGPFLLYEFEELRPIVYLEHHRTGAFVVDDDDIKDYRAAVDIIRGVAMSPAESLTLITDVLTTMEQS
ncbi:helix-turn-helix domain-containing protein [Actinokineospora sp.]|uniref:helix-turn-helix domain-containing protein n=1 Tax=Actinokineospora sp. TaxID=1872133 RepID=UPI0040378459